MAAHTGLHSLSTGPTGKSAYELAVEQGFVGTINQWILSLQGEDGLSAYALAVQEGFVGSLNEWILSLQGSGGTSGVDSIFGETGAVTLVDYMRFNTLAPASSTVGALYWDDVDGTVNVKLKGGNVTLQIGQEQLLRVRNSSGATIVNGSIVYIAGASSSRPVVGKAKADTNALSMGTIGMATEDIANNAEGYVTLKGLVRTLDTSGFVEGAELWLSAATAGLVTATRPVAPNHSVRIGWCVRSHPTDGIYLIDVDTGSELGELHDVKINSPTTGHVIRWNPAGYWENSLLAAGDIPVLNQNTAGNAATASLLQTARMINGVSFNGSANITINAIDSTARIAVTEKGASSGVCPLDSTAKVAASYLPAMGSSSACNLVINGAFTVNQRLYVSGALVGTNLYGHDRWKMRASGDSYTFSTTNNTTIVTIPAGKVLQQVIEGRNLVDGTHVLSWEGTAQGKIGAGSLGNSGITATLVGGVDTTIEFGPGTLSMVQLELGSTATPFAARLWSVEYDMCRRFYEKSYDYAAAIGAITYIGVCAIRRPTNGEATTIFNDIFKTQKRAIPTIIWYSPVTGAANAIRNISTSTDITITGTGSATPTSENKVGAPLHAADGVVGNAIAGHWVAIAEL